MNPALSVLLPVYRPKREYFVSAVQSILKQTFENFELLIVEAGLELSAESMVIGLDDGRIRYLPFGGRASLVRQLNYGLEQAKSDLVARMDADDWAYPDRFEKQMAYLEEHPEVSVVGTQLNIMDAQDKPLGSRRYPTEADDVAKSLRRMNALAHPSVMFRKAGVMEAGGYWDRLCKGNEDYELWCRLVGRGHRLANLDQTLLRYRIHGDAAKSKKLFTILRGTRRVKRHYFGDRMNAGDRMRYWAEGVLLNLPSGIVMELFRRMQYSQEPKL